MTRTTAELAHELRQVIVDVGEACGDDKPLTARRADEFVSMIEELDRPPIDLRPRMPQTLERADVEAAIRLAAVHGYADAQRAFIRALAARAPMLCTSLTARDVGGGDS